MNEQSTTRGIISFGGRSLAAHMAIEDRGAVEQAVSNASAGIDLVDALQHAS